MKGKGYFEQLADRRKRGVELYKKGWYQHEIAEVLGVTQPSVSKWVRAEAAGGDAALDSHPPRGSDKKISPEDLDDLGKLLLRSPREFGFESELWTSPMVTELIEDRYGVSYHPGNVRKLLRQMGFSPQKPVKRATQRDERAIEKWKNKEWPSIKKKPKRAARR